MTIIRKKIKRKLKSIINNDILLITPDLDVSYNIKFSLTSNNMDLGYFNVFSDENSNITGDMNTITVTGYTSSRLNELKKISKYDDLLRGYVLLKATNIRGTGVEFRNTGLRNRVISDPNIEKNGVDLLNSNENYIVYYIRDIKYIDDINTDVTTFMFIRDNSVDIDINYSNYLTYKNDNIFELTEPPRVIDDVNIIRNGTQIIKDIYWLRNIKDLKLLDYYGGNYYYIKKEE